MIFVQIASYRDPETLPTIVDCIAKAKYPKDLRFGICWQKHHSDQSLKFLSGHKAFRIEEIPWNQSRGLCWARSRIQQKYENEEYTLQLDSHHRFIQNWDAKLIDYMELTGSGKPILTSYAGAYQPYSEKRDSEPFMMVAKQFTESGTIMFYPHIIPGWQDMQKPMRARFVSGHFFFTLGRHCVEYKYDPDLYFAGDEISLSIRSFTMGYDLFHPHRNLIWHEYTRSGRVKHWDDHSSENKDLVGAAWHERDALSKRRLRKLLREEQNDEDLSCYDLGGRRSHRDYEIYAGINFALRQLHPDTLAGVEPPSRSLDEAEWSSNKRASYTINLKWDAKDIQQCNDTQFVYFGVEDSHGKVIFRHDAQSGSPEAEGRADKMQVSFESETPAAKLVVWPFSRSQKWLKKVSYDIE